MSKRKLSKKEWRAKFVVDNLQRENHQYRIRIEESAADSYVSNFVDIDSGNEKMHTLKLPSTNNLEQEWEDMMLEHMRNLNPMQRY